MSRLALSSCLIRLTNQNHPEEAVQAFLEPYGYLANDASAWADSEFLPELSLQVSGHNKVNHHTYYAVDCNLATAGLRDAGPDLSWRSPRRLAQLQQGLHDPVKKGLETCGGYKTCFAGTHFAHRYAGHSTSANIPAFHFELGRLDSRLGFRALARRQSTA